MQTIALCKDCQTLKPVEEFPLTYLANGRKDRRNQCKVCRAAYLKAYAESHRVKKRKDPPPGFRRCTICLEEKPLDQFYSHGRDGSKVGDAKRLSSRCKECAIQQVVKYNREHAEEARARNHAWRLRNRYGITPADYDALLKRQQGLCAICGYPPGPAHRLAVDHDHETNEVRGLLCDRCNLCVGMLEGSPGALERAVAYLKR